MGYLNPNHVLAATAGTNPLSWFLHYLSAKRSLEQTKVILHQPDRLKKTGSAERYFQNQLVTGNYFCLPLSFIPTTMSVMTETRHAIFWC